ncbi:MAG: MmgE/PrpD family protein [Deltaproteobacteria bacterium]|nr:MmgE/PrpD family protein [Deltaproteobacteria bacterium]
MEGTIAEKMGRFVAGLSYDNLPEEVIQKAKCCMINGIAIGISCHSVEFGRMARDLIKAEELGIPAEKGATLFCDGAKVTPMGAAFANAALFHGRAQEDTLGSSHTGTVISPAVLALAERDGYTGKQVLEAVIAGYEIVGALDRAVSGYTTPRGFRASPIFGIFGSASAAGKLLGLSEEETIKAIGFAAAFAGGTLECFAAGTMEWRFEVGVASREGILAALLAKQGAVSAPTAMEGDAGFLRAFADTTEGSESISRDLGKTWSIMSTGFKPYPVCAFNQTPVRIILGILEENDISHEDIEKVVVSVNPYEYHYAGMANRGPFDSVGATLMSTPFCAALALVDGQTTLDGLTRYDDPRIEDLINKTEHIPEDGIGRYCGAVTVRTKDGNTFEKEAKEGPEFYNFDMQQTIELAGRVTAETGVSPDKVDGLIDMIGKLDALPNVSELVKRLGSCP